MAVAKDQIRQIITENNITSVADVYSLLKDSFKDILQELLEAEMDATLGYEKNCKGDLKSDNKRNGHSPKTLKSQYGNFRSMFPVTAMVSLSQNSFPNISGIFPESRKR